MFPKAGGSVTEVPRNLKDLNFTKGGPESTVESGDSNRLAMANCDVCCQGFSCTFLSLKALSGHVRQGREEMPGGSCPARQVPL